MNINITMDDITADLLNTLISRDINDPKKQFMKTADEYFKVENSEITNRKKMMMLFDENENPYLKPDLSKANEKARHSYLQELINQCTNYLTSKPMKIDYKNEVSDEIRNRIDDELYKNNISDKVKDQIDDELYKNNNFLSFIQDNIDNIQLYGRTFFRIVKNENGENRFIIFDPKEMIMFYDDFDEPILAIRYYTKTELSEVNNKKAFEKVQYAEIYDKQYKETWTKSKKGQWEKGEREYIYAKKQTFINAETKEVMAENIEPMDNQVFPIIEWKFNKSCTPTLSNIKDFIDLQDINLSDLANNVEDIQEAIWILENYNGQNLQEFMEDLKIKKAIKVGAGGSAHSETVQIPIQARDKLYELCNKNIYKFGFGINFSERDSLGNVTGVALKWSYAPLEQKANAIENNGQEPLNNFFNILFRLLGVDYDSNDLEFVFDRTMIANEQEQTSTVMSASSQLSQKTILSNLPMVKDVDEEIKQLEEENAYEEPEPTNDEETDETGEEGKDNDKSRDEDTSNPDDNGIDKE